MHLQALATTLPDSVLTTTTNFNVICVRTSHPQLDRIIPFYCSPLPPDTVHVYKSASGDCAFYHGGDSFSTFRRCCAICWQFHLSARLRYLSVGDPVAVDSNFNFLGPVARTLVNAA